MTKLFTLNNSAASLHFGCASILSLMVLLQTTVSGKQNITAIAINQAIINQVPAKTIFKEIAEMARDNHQAMANLLGTDLLTSIVNIGHV